MGIENKPDIMENPTVSTKLTKYFIKLIKKSPKYIKTFGLISGILMLLKIERNLPQSSNTVRQYLIPKIKRRVSLRESVGDHATFWQCFVTRQFEISKFPQHSKLLVARYNSVIQSGGRPIIIDCGANIGLSTVWFAEEFPKAYIVVVEPDENNIKLLKENVENFDDRVKILIGGVWGKTTRLIITNPDDGSASFQVSETDNSALNSFQGYSIPSLLTAINFDEANDELLIMKLDVEGAEENIFKDNAAWVDLCALIILELHDWLLPWRGTSKSFFQCVSDFEFDYLMHDENIFCFNHKLETLNFKNTTCVPKN